jgi:predicted RecA/RadA family phage recombinase
MALKKPLVITNGQIQQLQVGDTLDATVAEQEVIQATNSNAGTIAIGRAVYVDGAGSVDLAQADASGTKDVVGLVADVSIASSASGNILTSGVLVATTGQWDAVTGGTGGLTAGAKYFLSEATAGALTTTAPTSTGDYVCPVGIGLSTTEMKLDIDTDVLL